MRCISSAILIDNKIDVMDNCISTCRWHATHWGELAKLEYGKALRGSDVSSGSYRVYGTNGPIGWHSAPLCSVGSVIIGRKGAYRGVHYSPDPFFVIDTAFYLKPKGELDTRWAYYQLLTQDINGMDSGSAIPSTSRDDFYGLPVNVPPLPEQRAIAHVLGTLDDKIELNRRMNETLEEMARALFKSWFVDFDPVRARAALKQHALRGDEAEAVAVPASQESQWTVERARAYLAGLDPQIVDLFPDRLVDSELGGIPEGWEVGLFSDVVAQVRGSENPLMAPDTIFSHYSIPAYDEGQTAKRELGESIKSVKARVLPDVVLLSKLNPEIERVWLPDTATAERAICSTEFLVLQSKPPFHRAYVYCLARSAAFQQRLRSLVTGTSKSHQRAPAGAVLSLQAIVPCAPAVEVFSQQASILLSGSRRCRRENITLAAQRDALLPKLVSGTIRLRDAARQAEAVA